MTRRRVLLTADTVGGVWQYATDLARALAADGDAVVLAVLGPAPDAGQRAAVAPGVTLVETGLALDWLAAGPDEVAAAAAGVAEIAGDVGATVVQLNTPALAAACFRVPVVAVAHSCTATWWQAAGDGALPAPLAWQARLTGAGLAAADAVVAPSAAFAEATMRAHRLRVRPAVVHNGRTAPARPAAAAHDFAFTAGRLWDRGKDVATLDRAAARLGVPFKAAGATCGPNGERIDLHDLVALGRLGDAGIAAQLAAGPVFASAAVYEPFGLAVLEAAAAGCALVLADIATFRELWADAAVFVAPGDDRGFAAAIETIVGDAGRRRDLGAAARARAARFTPAATAAGMARVYRSVEARVAA